VFELGLGMNANQIQKKKKTVEHENKKEFEKQRIATRVYNTAIYSATSDT
jgi:hypothetical protein